MSGFIQGLNRSQATLLPECIDDYVEEDNLVRVIDEFVDSLDLFNLEFKTIPAETGRPGYHPATLLKLYIYGYLNRIQSTRRLETEAKRNLEVMWLIERLAPDFKTIADFRKDYGKSIQNVCREFVLICRKLKLLSHMVAIDGSKFKAVNNADKYYSVRQSSAHIDQLDKSIQQYLDRLKNSEKYESKPLSSQQKTRMKERIKILRKEIAKTKSIHQQLKANGTTQISLTDPDARSMKSKNRGFVGYNVQSVVDCKSHIIINHEVTNDAFDKNALASNLLETKRILKAKSLKATADRGFYNGVEIKSCEDNNIKTYIPKTQTSNNRSKGQFDKSDFKWSARRQGYICPAGDLLTYRTTMMDNGRRIFRYWSSNCGDCKLKEKCTSGKERRVSRWEHEDVLDKVEKRLVQNPMMMKLRKSTVEHPFGTIKSWMGNTHFQMKRFHNVSTEMSLHVLAYNMKRVVNLIGMKKLMQAMAG